MHHRGYTYTIRGTTSASVSDPMGRPLHTFELPESTRTQADAIEYVERWIDSWVHGDDSRLGGSNLYHNPRRRNPYAYDHAHIGRMLSHMTAGRRGGAALHKRIGALLARLTGRGRKRNPPISPYDMKHLRHMLSTHRGPDADSLRHVIDVHARAARSKGRGRRRR
jgi:hypothetical protein